MEGIANYDHISNIVEVRDLMNMELNRAAVSFVRIGYLLKTVRDDPDMLKDTPYSSVNEFAMAEFGLDKSAVSRFMRINDRFSLGGYSEQLRENYEGFGSAKLSLMLTLPDEINEELSPEYTKSDIETIKAEYDAEKKISDLEVMMEDKEDGPDEFIAGIVKELNDEHPDAAIYLNDTMKLAAKMGIAVSEADIMEAYIPNEVGAYSIRIPGQGRFMVSMKPEGITITNMRDPENKSHLSWQEFKDILMEDMKVRDFPEETKKPEKKKTEKVKPAKPKTDMGKTIAAVEREALKSAVAPVQPESVQEEAETDEKVQKAEENAQDENENVQEADIPAEVVEDPEDKPAAGDEEPEEKPQPQDEGDAADEAQAAAGVEKVTPDTEDVLTSSQRDMLDWLDLIRRKVVPEDGSRPDWRGIHNEVKTMERYVKQFTY
ncbi:MAG: hypothetical protein IKH82_05595 [Clostridiales bacterium]|nr:hypothetical protein [Clostridiales bacterium]